MKSNAIVAQMQEHIWVMDPRYLDALIMQMVGVDLPLISEIQIAANKPAMQIKGSVAIIPIVGVLMKSVPSIFKWFGITATEYADIRAQIAEALANESVTSIQLYIDSPGGQVAGVMETAEAISQAARTKQVTANISDLGASGAYWLASQANDIGANANAMIGSVGVYTVYVDYAKMAESDGVKVHVIRSGEYKGMGVIGAPISDKQISAMQEVIDGMAGNFITAISKGRKMKKTDVSNIATGQIWLANNALDKGLIDNIVNGQTTTTNKSNSKGSIMSETKSNTAAAESSVDIEAVRNEAAAQEQQRLAALSAAFPGEATFVVEQFEAGSNVTEAKAAFSDVLQRRLDEAHKEQESAGNSDGADPIEHNAAAGTAAGGDENFMDTARQRSKDDKISMTKAMQLVARENPELHRNFRNACAEKARPVAVA